MGQAGRTPLHLAVRLGDAECMELLLDRSADVNAVDKVRGWWVEDVGGAKDFGLVIMAETSEWLL